MSITKSGPQRLYLMQVGSVPERNLPFVCYLVQTADGKNVLIDSGLPPITEVPPGMPMPAIEKNVIEQLATVGLKPENINILVCTHFDGDHTGYHEAFTQAEMVVQRQHYATAQTDQRFAASRPHWDQPIERYRFVDGDTQLLPGLELIETSGHTPGHQSVLVRLPNTGPVLLTIDAVPAKQMFTVERHASRNGENEEALRASTKKLLDLVQREQISLVIFGHDGDQWKTLKKLPDFYS